MCASRRKITFVTSSLLPWMTKAFLNRDYTYSRWERILSFNSILQLKRGKGAREANTKMTQYFLCQNVQRVIGVTQASLINTERAIKGVLINTERVIEGYYCIFSITG